MNPMFEKEYYLKGGKAFNYYYPGQMVVTSDFDLVATNRVCSLLFEELHRVLLGNWIEIEQYEPFLVETISIQDESWVDTVGKGKHKVKTSHRVKSLKVNQIGLMDVIIVDSIPEDEIDSSFGINLMEFETFKDDIKLVFFSRRKKLSFKGWDVNSDKYNHVKSKHDKSYLRHMISSYE
jgi:hypothetical protein